MKRLYLLFIIYIFPITAFADFINLVQADKCETILEIFISDDNITAKIEIGEQDYPWFCDVIPEEFYRGGFSADDEKIRWSNFMRNQFVLRSGNKILDGEIKVIEPRKRIPRTGSYSVQVDSIGLNKSVIYVEIIYRVTNKLNEISITPPLREGNETTLANIGFIVYHKTIPVNDLRFLLSSETFQLDWEDPWYSSFENPDISRHHKSSFMSFLYVEPYEIRHEFLGRIKDLEGWIDLNYNMDDIIKVEDQDSLKKRIANFLVKRNRIRIDGAEQTPIIDRIHFVEVNLSGVQVIEIPKPLPYASAIVGIIFAYPNEGIPNEITLHWDMFNDKIQLIPCMSIDPAGPWPHDLQPSDSILKWTNFLKHYKLPTVTEQKVESANIHVPLFTIVFILMILFLLYRNHWNLNSLSKWRKFFFVLYILLAVLAFPIGYQASIPFIEKKAYSAPEAKELISHLLRNTYRAFDFRDEADIYDKLSMSNDTGLLQRIYLQTRKSMIIENQGGISVRVDEVLVTKVEKKPEEDNLLVYRCNWIVKGVVGHWGHKHQRVNQYDAIIKIKPVNGSWKMYDLDVIEEVRL